MSCVELDPACCSSRRIPRETGPGVVVRGAHLPDGTCIPIRPVAAHDRDVILDLYSRLSPTSRYQRSFSSPDRLPELWADALANHSHVDRLGPVAEARYDRCGESSGSRSSSRRAALTWLRSRSSSTMPGKRKGLGRLLFCMLLTEAEARGKRYFVANVHRNNARVIQAIHRAARILTQGASGEVTRVVFTKRSSAHARQGGTNDEW